MRILHLLSNRKWTERSEPVADLVLAQQELGHEAYLACGKWPGEEGKESSVEHQATLKGLTPFVMNMDKHFRWSSACSDVAALRNLIKETKAEVVHAHMENAHLLAAAAIRKLHPKPLLINSSYAVDGPRRGFRSSLLHRHFTDGLVVIGDQARRAVAGTYQLPMAVIEPGIDIARFDPKRTLTEGSSSFDFDATRFVAGMVTRIRSDRRVDLAIEAVAKLAADQAQISLLIIGHGEDDEAMRQLAKERGVDDHVVFAGYHRGDDLVAAYRAMDALLYPVPGTDQSCRTVREAMASGVPAIAQPVGFLNELIEENVTGLFAEATVACFAETLKKLSGDGAQLSKLKASTLARAKERFPLSVQAEKTVAFYETLRSTRGAME